MCRSKAWASNLGHARKHSNSCTVGTSKQYGFLPIFLTAWTVAKSGRATPGMSSTVSLCASVMLCVSFNTPGAMPSVRAPNAGVSPAVPA